MEQRMHGLVGLSSIRPSGTSYVGTPRLQLHRLAAARLCAPNGCLSYAFTPTDGVVGGTVDAFCDARHVLDVSSTPPTQLGRFPDGVQRL